MKIFRYFNKNVYFIISVVTLFLFFSTKSYSEAVTSHIADSVFRLHVIANSDSEEDQSLKYKVRDSLIDYMKNITSSSTSKEEAMSIAYKHLENFKMIAKKTILDNGFNYNVDVEIGNYSFPTKNYGDISLPAGCYDALKVKIGEASGQNWWCVMFPPLCFVDITSAKVSDESKESLKNELSDEDYNLISQSDDISEFKFKIVELFNSLAQN